MAALAEEVPVEAEALAAEVDLVEVSVVEVSVVEALVEAVPAEAGRLKYEVRSGKYEVKKESRHKKQDLRIRMNNSCFLILHFLATNLHTGKQTH